MRHEFPKLFKLTADHITLLRAAYWGWQHFEGGAPGVDAKRPYGNSDVESDVAELLGWDVDEENGLTDEQRERAYRLHRETETALEIVLGLADVPLGTYRLVSGEYARHEWKFSVPAAGAAPTEQSE